MCSQCGLLLAEKNVFQYDNIQYKRKILPDNFWYTQSKP